MKSLKILFNVLSLLIIIAVAYLGVVNAGIGVDFAINGTTSAHMSLIYVIFATLIAGMVAGALWISSFYFNSKTTLKEYKRQLEKKSVCAESDSSRVKVLESKIEVLEKALKSALEKK